jgi:hypothetical protein
MATSLVEIEHFLIKQELRHDINEERGHILTGFAMENYRDKDGDNYLQIVIQLEENGEFLKVYTPKCYQYAGDNKSKVFQVLLMVSWKTKMIQFEYDHSDGEVRAVIEFPLEDSVLTERQLMRSVVSLAQIIDRYDSTILTAISSGEIIFEEDDKESMMQLLQQMLDAAHDLSEEESDDDDDDMEFI